jgi:alpha-L-fucosidase
MHWGVYATIDLHDAWFWQAWKDDKSPDTVEFMKNNYRPGYTYADFAEQFRAEFFNASVVEDIVRASGAK